MKHERRYGKIEKKIKTNNGFDIYKENYWDMTEKIEVKVEIGWKRKR